MEYKALFESENGNIVIFENELTEEISIVNKKNKSIKTWNYGLFGINNVVIFDLLSDSGVENGTIMEYEKSEMARFIEELER